MVGFEQLKKYTVQTICYFLLVWCSRIEYIYLPNPTATIWHKVNIFKGGTVDSNLEFSFS